MSITQETLKQHLKDPAIFCCRRQKGLVISAADLEDPTLFDDMVEAGLLTLSDEGLTIEQVLGSTLQCDVEALTPITKAVLDKINEIKADAPEAPAPKAEVQSISEAEPTVSTTEGGSGMIHIEIGHAEKFEGLSIDVPIAVSSVPSAPAKAPEAVTAEADAPKAGEKKVIRTLKKRHIKITDAEIGTETSIYL